MDGELDLATRRAGREAGGAEGHRGSRGLAAEKYAAFFLEEAVYSLLAHRPHLDNFLHGVMPFQRNRLKGFLVELASCWGIQSPCITRCSMLGISFAGASRVQEVES